jgi:Ca-activated chloride channel homolog
MPDISFTYPWMFVFLALYILLIFFFEEQKSVLYFSNFSAWAKMPQKRRGIFLPFLIFTCMLVALADPFVADHIKTDSTKGYQIGLLLDTSLSMNDNDKFVTAKKILKRFIKRRKYDRLSLVVFGDYPRVVSPLTYDKAVLLHAIKYLKAGMAGARETAIYDSLYLGIDLFTKVSTRRNKIMILLTDGRNSTGVIPLRIAVAKAKKYHIKVYTVAVGDKKNFDSKALRQIAKETGGKFYEAIDPKRLLQIYDDIDALTKEQIQTTDSLQKRHLFEYPLAAALALLFWMLVAKRRNDVL